MNYAGPEVYPHKPELGLKPCLLTRWYPNDRIWKSKWRVQGLRRPEDYLLFTVFLQAEEQHGTITRMLAWELCIATLDKAIQCRLLSDSFH